MKIQTALLVLAIMSISPMVLAERSVEINGRTVSNKWRTAPPVEARYDKAIDISKFDIDVIEEEDKLIEENKKPLSDIALDRRLEMVKKVNQAKIALNKLGEELGKNKGHKSYSDDQSDPEASIDISLDQRLEIAKKVNEAKIAFDKLGKAYSDDEVSANGDISLDQRLEMAKKVNQAKLDLDKLGKAYSDDEVSANSDISLDRRLEIVKKVNEAKLDLDKLGKAYSDDETPANSDISLDRRLEMAKKVNQAKIDFDKLNPSAETSHIEEKLESAVEEIEEIDKSIEKMKEVKKLDEKKEKEIVEFKSDLDTHKDKIEELLTLLDQKNGMLNEMLEKQKNEGSSKEIEDEISCLREELIALESRYFELSTKHKSMLDQYEELKVDINVEITEVSEEVVVKDEEVKEEVKEENDKKKEDCVECSVSAMFKNDMSMSGIFSVLNSGIQTALYTQEVFNTYFQYELRKSLLMPTSLYGNLPLGLMSLQSNQAMNLSSVSTPLSLMQNIAAMNSGSITNNYYKDSNNQFTFNESYTSPFERVNQNDFKSNLMNRFNFSSAPTVTDSSVNENGSWSK